MKTEYTDDKVALLRVKVTEEVRRVPSGVLRCVIGRDLEIDTLSLETYFFAEWDELLYDALIVAAAVEFCDRVQKRLSGKWGRKFELEIPVHDAYHWNSSQVSYSLKRVLDFLTGDDWMLSFVRRKHSEAPVRQIEFPLSSNISTILPFSDGLDSLAVAGLLRVDFGNELELVRLGRKSVPRRGRHYVYPFTAVPFRVSIPGKQVFESSVRSRGFKFSIISAIAAFMSNAPRVILPESGQGALGPVISNFGDVYPDYRNHPAFTARMGDFIHSLFGRRIIFELPRIWHTKGETLKKYLDVCEEASSQWQKSLSCWQGNRQVSVNKKHRQCGVCAACLLRRLSIQSAGLIDVKESYVWENLGSNLFEDGVAAGFPRNKITSKMKDYMVAGVLHLDYLALIKNDELQKPSLDRSISELARVTNSDIADIRQKLERMLDAHKNEWSAFLRYLGDDSFIRNFTKGY
jgi:hypothetical protein